MDAMEEEAGGEGPDKDPDFLEDPFFRMDLKVVVSLLLLPVVCSLS